MAGPFLPLLGLAALALISSSRRRTTGTYYGASGRVCALPVVSVSLEDAGEQDRWIRCAGRTQGDAQALADRLTAAGRTQRAARVLALYARRRRVEDSPPSASSSSAATRAEVERTLAADPHSIPVEPPSETVAPTPDAQPPGPVSHGGTTTPTGRRHRTTAPGGNYADSTRPVPSGFSGARAASLAPQLRDCIQTRHAASCRRRTRQFQLAAGIPVDGDYGTLTYHALVFWLGGSGAPPVPPTTLRDDPRLAYVAPGGVTAPHVPTTTGSEAADAEAGARLGRDMTRDEHHV